MKTHRIHNVNKAETESTCSCVVELVVCLTLLQNAPHTMNLITSSEWNLPYSREKAAFPAVSYTLTS